MNYFASPPSSPQSINNSIDKVICGSCDKTLSSDWFCSDCHTKCKTCNRFLTQDEFCTRCWSFDDHTRSFVRKNTNYNHFYLYYYYYQHQPASPTYEKPSNFL